MHKPLHGSFMVAEIVAMGLLAGCGATFDYDELRSSSASGEGFAPALSREYKGFALFETDEMMDWPDAAHFGEKTLLAARGTVPPPERVEDWRIPRTHVGELSAARARLAGALEKGAGQRWPQDAAVAQVSFDCWVEQQEENWQFDHIAACRNKFYATMKTLDERIAAADAPTGLEPAMASGEERLRSFVVPFAFDSAALTDGADETVEAVAQLAKTTDDVRVSVDGHADRAGTDPYNERLSMRRAEALTRALVEKGIPADRIQVAAYGERRPVMPTGDGVPDMRNRRVEVTVGSAGDF